MSRRTQLDKCRICTAAIEDAHGRGWPLFTSYGMTEMASQIATTPPGAPRDALFTAGRVLPYRELNIAADGELSVRGRTRFLGYLQKDQTLCRPFDAEEAYGDVPRVDLGALRLPARVGMELRLEVEEATKRVIAATSAM